MYYSIPPQIVDLNSDDLDRMYCLSEPSEVFKVWSLEAKNSLLGLSVWGAGTLP